MQLARQTAVKSPHGCDGRHRDRVQSPRTRARCHRRTSRRCAKDGWRLVSVIGSTAGPLLFFEREAGEQRPPQESWRTQHGGEDDV
jgi:hypothetical protein